MPGEPDHLRRHIQPDDPALFAYLPRGDKAADPSAATQVKHNLSILKPCNDGGVTAAQFQWGRALSGVETASLERAHGIHGEGISGKTVEALDGLFR